MKKKIIILLSVLICIVVGLALWLAANASNLATQYKPDIETALSQTLKKSVSLGAISASIFPSIKLDVDRITIKNNAAAKTGLQLNRLEFSLKLAALMSGRLVIDKLTLIQPEIKLIKNNQIAYIDGLKPVDSNLSTENSKALTTSPAKSNDKAAGLPSAIGFNLEHFLIRDGLITIEDQTQNKTINLTEFGLSAELAITGNNANLKKVSLATKLEKELPIAINVNSIDYNLKDGILEIPDSKLKILNGIISNKIKLNSNNQTGTIQVSSDNFPLDQVVELLKTLKIPDAGLKLSGLLNTQSDLELKGPAHIALNGATTISQTALSVANIQATDISANISHVYSNNTLNVKDSQTAFKINNSPFTIDWALDLVGDKLTAKPVNLDGLGGKVSLSASATLTGNKPFSTKVEINSISIAQAASTFIPNLPLKVEGNVQNFSAQVSGAADASLLNSLTGSGSLSVAPAVIKNINIAGAALKSVSGLPFLTEALLNKVPENLRAAFTDPDSKIDQAKIQWSIRDSVISLSNFQLNSQLYQITGSGSITLNQQLDLKAELLLSPELSQAMIAKTKELKYMIDSAGRISFPVIIQGQAPKLIVTPQLDKILKNAATETVKDKIAEGLGRALGGGKEQGKALKDLFGF